jgi:hypothetical protein
MIQQMHISKPESEVLVIRRSICCQVAEVNGLPEDMNLA